MFGGDGERPGPSLQGQARLLVWIALGVAAVTTSGCAVWRLGQAAELIRRSEPFEQRPDAPRKRLLIVGDSTAVGTGASSPAHSLPGLIARGHPRLLIENRARDGARFAEVAAQLELPGHFDLVLVMAGGNDVIKMRRMADMHRDILRVLHAAHARGEEVIIMPPGNVGNAPFFFVPVSWWMSSRAREMHRLVASAAQASNAIYVDLFKERENDPFVLTPALNARDGLHPSDAGYRVWWQALQRQADLARHLRQPVSH